MVATGRRPGTVALRMSHAKRFIEHINGDIQRFTRGEIITWMAGQQWAPATRASARASIRMLGRWMFENGVISVDPTNKLPTVLLPRAVPLPVPDPIVLAAIRAADDRVRIMLELMALCGLRRGEVAKVRAADITRSEGVWLLRVEGKGGHVRVVPCPPHLGRQISAVGGWLFPGQCEGHISAAHVGKLVSRALPEDWTGHKLRHRFATAAYRATHDIRAVQELLGHAKIETTRVYIGVSPSALGVAARAAWRIEGG
ncbi:Tyrosine recombinase XerC [Corynebacterium freiburgense]|nr:Tyrosine recombinase XerC [Corynebacterium freiburgense]